MKTVKKNLLDTTEGIIGHSVNCSGVMGKGIALAIRNKYPLVYDKFIEFSKPYIYSPNLLGFCQIVKVSSSLSIANLFTQVYYGKSSPYMNICHACYSSIGESIKQLLKIGKTNNHPIYIPRISSMNAGGNWEIIKLIIQDCEKYVGCELTVCDPNYDSNILNDYERGHKDGRHSYQQDIAFQFFQAGKLEEYNKIRAGLE